MLISSVSFVREAFLFWLGAPPRGSKPHTCVYVRALNSPLTTNFCNLQPALEGSHHHTSEQAHFRHRAFDGVCPPGTAAACGEHLCSKTSFAIACVQDFMTTGRLLSSTFPNQSFKYKVTCTIMNTTTAAIKSVIIHL